MSKVSYLEFRPGRWVKLVDGKVVGPATPAEVAAWQQEQAAQARIWEDVLKQAATPAQQPTTPSQAATHKKEPAERPSRHIEHEHEAKTALPDQIAGIETPHHKATTKTETQPRVETTHPPTARAVHPTEAAKPTQIAHREELPRATKPEVTHPTKVTKLEPTQIPSTEEATKAQPTKAQVLQPAEAAKHEPAPEAKTAISYAEPAKLEGETESMPSEAMTTVLPQATEAQVTRLDELTKAEPESQTIPPVKVTKYRPKRSRTSTSARQRTAKGKRAKDITSQAYLWIMADPVTDLADTVRAWLPKYEERFNKPAGVVLCHAEDLPALEKAKLPVDVRQAKGVPPRNFWIGPKS